MIDIIQELVWDVKAAYAAQTVRTSTQAENAQTKQDKASTN